MKIQRISFGRSKIAYGEKQEENFVKSGYSKNIKIKEPEDRESLLPLKQTPFIDKNCFEAMQKLDEKFKKRLDAIENDPILNYRKNTPEEARFPETEEKIEIIEGRSQQTIDMEKLKSIILPKVKVDKPKSFEDSDKKFILDKYQKEAIDSFISGYNTIVTAPTGTGKTLIAEYGIEDALKNGERIIYLSPLKALSNEKFVKFSELFGKYDEKGNLISSDNVGIITGDVSINPDAQLLIMTTEIYRNKVNKADPEVVAEEFKDFSGVIYDEFHYLKDPDRGTVWEESVMHTPKHMRQMMLSATASNANEISQWLDIVSPQNGTKLINVPENERYVPLKEFVFGYRDLYGYQIEQLFDRKIDIDYLKNNKSDRAQETIAELEKIYGGKNYLEILENFAQDNKLIDADEFAQMLTKTRGVKKDKAEQIAYVLSNPDKSQGRNIRLKFPDKYPPIPSLVRILNQQNMTPALFFIFSKKRCKKALDETADRLGPLLNLKESKRVLDIVNEAKEKNIYLGDDFEKEYLPNLLMGYAVHHAGMLPAYKSLVEKLSREGLVKACFATETLLAGINMPFKTTVFTSVKKSDGKREIIIPATTYKQGAGRAGRRGIDDVGNVIICPTSRGEFEIFKDIIDSKDTKINSVFNPSYATLLQDSTINQIDEFVENSFYSYQLKKTKGKINEARNKLNYLEEKGYIKKVDGKSVPTRLGKMAQKVYGINQILFCELIDDPKYTSKLSPEELAALMIIFADINDKKSNKKFKNCSQEISDKLSPAIELAEQIKKEQSAHKINEEIKMSTNLVPAILRFAYMPKAREEDCIREWDTIFQDLQRKYIIMHEGDLLRVFNSTIDLLRTVIDVTDNPYLAWKANQAIECLKKPPLTDILKYELDI